MNQTKSNSKPYKTFVLVVLLVALLVRTPLINSSFWLDEAAQALESTRPLSAQLNISHDFQPPLYHLFIYILAQINKSEWWLRLSSVTASLVILFLTIKITQKLLGEKASLMAGLLLATSQFCVYYSQELRPYSLAALWGVLALYLLQLHPRSKWIIIVNALGLLTVYTYIFAIVGQVILVLSSKRIPLKLYLISLSLSLLLCLPWLPHFLSQYRVGTALRVSLPGWSYVVSPPTLKALPLLFQKFAIGRIDIPNQTPNLLLYGLITALIFSLSLLSFKTNNLRPLFYYFYSIIISAFFLNIFIPILDAKRLLFILPVFIILIIGGALRFKKAIVIFGLLLSLNIISLVAYWTKPDLQREPWREAITQLELEASPQASILFPFTEPYSPWVWYSQANLDAVSTGYLVNKSLNVLDPKLENLLSRQDVYFFDYLSDLTDPAGLTLSWLIQSGFREVGYHQYPGIGKIRHFQKNTPFAYLFVR